eukprot:UN07449
MQIFSSQQLFECKVPRESEKQLLFRRISTRNSVFFRTSVNSMLILNEKLLLLTQISFKKITSR